MVADESVAMEASHVALQGGRESVAMERSMSYYCNYSRGQEIAATGEGALARNIAMADRPLHQGMKHCNDGRIDCTMNTTGHCNIYRWHALP